MAFAGDGGTFDIGLNALSGVTKNNEDILYVCLDNEAYMNTGIQVSSATPSYAWTGTTPEGNPRRKKNIMEIMAAHYNPYSATATIGFPRDLQQKIARAKAIRGTKFIHMLVPCPTGWRTPIRSFPRTVHSCRGSECLSPLRGDRWKKIHPQS